MKGGIGSCISNVKDPNLKQSAKAGIIMLLLLAIFNLSVRLED